MKLPQGTKLGVWGFVIGVVVTMIVGFNWGGWVTGGTADKQAKQSAETAVLAALTPICIAQSQRDGTKAKEIVVMMKAADYWKRGDILKPTGWATMPGASEPNADVVKRCAEQLIAAST